jgi:hypothetical protein
MANGSKTIEGEEGRGGENPKEGKDLLVGDLSPDAALERAKAGLEARGFRVSKKEPVKGKAEAATPKEAEKIVEPAKPEEPVKSKEPAKLKEAPPPPTLPVKKLKKTDWEKSVEPLVEEVRRKKFKIGGRVRVVRTDGRLEDDWAYLGFDPKHKATIRVQKKEGDKFVTKNIPVIDFLAVNPLGSDVVQPQPAPVEKLPGWEEVEAPTLVAPAASASEVVKPPEAPPKPKAVYKPRYVSPESMRTGDLEKWEKSILQELTWMGIHKIEWGARVDFLRDLLNRLDKSEPLYSEKKAKLEEAVQIVEKARNDEETLRRDVTALGEASREAKETATETRVVDVAYAEGVSESEARQQVTQETQEAQAQEKSQDEKLQKLEAARERLVKAEKNKKDYEGLIGSFKSWIKKGDKKSEAEVEYEAAKETYRAARAEYVAGSVDKMLKERMAFADHRARELYEARGKIYRAWKWLGEQNVEKLMPKKWKEGLVKWRPEGKFGKAAKFFTRFGAKFLSLRTGASFGLLGVGIWGGVGTAAAVSLLAARRAIGGLAAGFGAYDLLRRGQESWAVTKWHLSWKPWEMKKAMAKEDVTKLSKEELEERMAHFEMHAALGNSKVEENDIYKLLIERYKEITKQEAEAKSNEAAKFLEEQMGAADDKLKEWQAKAKRNERIMKGVALGMGLISSSGLISKLISGKWGWEQFSEAREAKTEMRQQIGQAPETPEAAPPAGPVEVPSADFPAEAVAAQAKLPKEFVMELAGPDNLLTPDETAELGALQRQLTEMGLDPQSSEVIRGLGISKIEDITEAQNNLRELANATRDAEILKEIISRGLNESDAGNLKSLLQNIDRVGLSQETKSAAIASAIENNFEDSGDIINILKNVDLEHLKIAGIIKPDGIYDLARLREIAGAQTITIDKKGEGIYKALLDYYRAPPEQGGLGLSGRELRQKIVEQMRNEAFYKNGQLQDLVEVGDQIKVDSKGNVLLFIAEDGKMERCRDILDLVSDRAFRSGNQVFQVAEGVRLHEALHPIDGHVVIKLTGPDGATHTISDWSVGRTARIDGQREILEDWLRRNNLLAGVERAPLPAPTEELSAASETRRTVLTDEPRRLRDEFQNLTEARATGDEAAASAAETEIRNLEETTGVSHEAATEAAAAVVSESGAAVLGNAPAYNEFLQEYGHAYGLGGVRVEDIGSMSLEQLQSIDSGLDAYLESTSGPDLPPEALSGRGAVQTLQEYIHEQEAILGGRETVGAVSEPPVEVRPETFAIALPGERMSFEGGEIRFYYDVFGNPNGFQYEGVRGNPLRAQELLHADWAAKVEAASPENIYGARTDVQATARKLEIFHRVLESLEGQGRGATPEAEFLRRSMGRMIETAREEYGDVFR